MLRSVISKTFQTNFLKQVNRNSNQIFLNAVRYDHHGGVPGENLPFKVGSAPRMTLIFVLYFGIASTAPWLVVRYQLWKKNG